MLNQEAQTNITAMQTPDFKDPVNLCKTIRPRITSASIMKEHIINDQIKASKAKLKSPSPT